LVYKDFTLNIPAFREFLRRQQLTLAAELRKLCLLQPGEEGLPDFDLAKLQDDASNNQTGWSFLEQPANQLAQWKDWLMNRIADQEHLRKQFFAKAKRHSQAPGPRPEPQWQHNEVEQYLKLRQQFLQRLALLFLLLGGQPPR